MNLDTLRSYKPVISTIAAKYGVRNIRVFGSVARGEASEASDVDLMVDMEEGRSLFDFVRFKREVESTLRCAVDVLEEDADIHPIIRQNITQESLPL